MSKLDRFLSDCIAALEQRKPQSSIQELLDRFISHRADVERALGRIKCAGIDTIYHSSALTILNVTWAPHMKIFPHDHRLWAVIGIYTGREDNAFYKREGKIIVPAGGKRLDEKESVILGNQIIHAVENPLGEFTGAIHVYGGDFFAVKRSEFDPISLAERPYNVERTMKVFAEANQHKTKSPG